MENPSAKDQLDEHVDVSFEQVDDNLTKVKVVRDGEEHSVILFTLSEDDVDDLMDIRRKMHDPYSLSL